MSELVTPCIRKGGIELVYVSCLDSLETTLFATKCGTLGDVSSLCLLLFILIVVSVSLTGSLGSF